MTASETLTAVLGALMAIDGALWWDGGGSTSLIGLFHGDASCGPNGGHEDRVILVRLMGHCERGLGRNSLH